MDYLKNAGIMPHRTTEPGEAYLFWCIDGASILLTGRTDPAALTEGVRAIFGAHLPAGWPEHAPGGVATNSDPTQQGFDFSTRTLLSASRTRLDAHNDGAVGFSDVYPDLLALLCETTAPSGGESFMVDGHYLCGAIARDPAQRELTRFLWAVPIEQCARMEDRPPGTPGFVRSRRPIVSRTVGGRLTVRYNREHQRVLDDGAVSDADRAHLATWLELGLQAATAAPRFLLHPGELLVLDNYRVFHGREAYDGADRFLHRVLGFTDMSMAAQP